MKRRQVLVCLIAVLTLAVVAPALADDPGRSNSDFFVQNIGTPTAAVRVEYYNQGGTPVASSTETINGHGSFPFLVSQLPVYDGWMGSMAVLGNKQTPTTVRLTWQSQSGSLDDQITTGAYSGMASSGLDVYFPYATIKPVQGGGLNRFSILTIQNVGLGSASASISLSYYDETTGDLTDSINDTIEAHGSKTYNLSDGPGWPIPDLGGNWQGSVYVHSSDQPIAGVATTHWVAETSQQWASAYEGAAGGSTVLRAPSISRVVTGGTTWVRASNILVMNVGEGSTDITIALYRTGESTPAMTIEDTLDPKQVGEYNTRYGSPTNNNYPPSAFESELGNSFNGSAVISSDGEPLAAAIHTFWFQASENAASSYIAKSGGDKDLYVPYAPRIVQGETWLEWCKLVVQNVGDSTADLDIEFYRTDGSSVPIIEDTIPVNSGNGYNTRFGSDNGSVSAWTFEQRLGDDFNGNVHINSTQPIVVVVNLLQKPAASSTYSAYVPQ